MKGLVGWFPDQEEVLEIRYGGAQGQVALGLFAADVLVPGLALLFHQILSANLPGARTWIQLVLMVLAGVVLVSSVVGIFLVFRQPDENRFGYRILSMAVPAAMVGGLFMGGLGGMVFAIVAVACLAPAVSVLRLARGMWLAPVIRRMAGVILALELVFVGALSAIMHLKAGRF